MKRTTRSSGMILIEVLTAALMALLVGIALVVLIQTTYASSSAVSGQNLTNAGERMTLDTLADHLRLAQSVNTGGTTYAVIAAASASDITIYTDSAGDTARYWLDTTATPYALKCTQTTGGTSTTSTVLTGVASLQFTYYLDTGAFYTEPASKWVTTADPNAPATAEIPNVGAININATVTLNGYNSQVSTFVRLRNSPYKTDV